MSNNNSIITEIRSIVLELDHFLSAPHIKEKINNIIKPLLDQISEHQPYAVDEISAKDLSRQAPDIIGSIRVAVFYPNGKTRVERHPNSTQFLFSLSGTGTTKVLRNENWETDTYGQDIINPALEKYWHYTPQNIWHQSVATGNTPWCLMAVHTAEKVEDEYQ